MEETMSGTTPKRKLIEVALPLEAINRESAREKAIRHGHPSTLHLWWARRPLAAARAVLFAQLVDDPSAHPEDFPTEELQRKERDRLHKLIERLVVWENARDEKLLAEAYAEILKSTNGNPPPILDPFAGGGTIPLEAQRLGLEAHASDLNPVAVLINKALVEIPPQFNNKPPVYPGIAESEIREWCRAEGLAADVRAYSNWMFDEAKRRIGSLYPEIDGHTVIAYLWARTVTCPNPACRMEMPLVRSWWLGKIEARKAYIVPTVISDPNHTSGLRVDYTIGHGSPGPASDGTMQGRNGAKCLACHTFASIEYLKTEGAAGRIGAQLMAIATEGQRQRIYMPPTELQIATARVKRPQDVPDAQLSTNSQYMGAPLYGMKTIVSLFTNRQLVALTTFADLVEEVRLRARSDGASEVYASAIATYLGIGVSRYANFINALCQWRPDPNKEMVGHLFARQAIPIVWDFAESNPFSNSAGGWLPAIQFIPKVLEYLPSRREVEVRQADAASRSFEGMLVSTDPPYYDNVPYADLSDFFYFWLRRILRPLYPDILATMLVPKSQELVANPSRQGGKASAKEFFESGFRSVFERIRSSSNQDYPITVYYAFKQAESTAGGIVSTGWETLLEGMIQAGWAITATWPLRSELGNRIRSIGSNALASSIVLALRPRSKGAEITDRRSLIAALQTELPEALRKLQQGRIAPVDLPQAAIGPGMAVFSRYASVLESDGTRMGVRSALARINEILDQVLNEQEGDFDSTTRFSIAWYRQHGYGVGKYGDAELLANARGVVVQSLDRDGVLVSRAGNVNLIKPENLTWDYNPVADLRTGTWEVLHHLIKVLERDGIAPAGDFLQAALSQPDGAVDADLVKELGHLLFRIAEDNGWTKDALSFNNLVTSWPEIVDVARSDKPDPAVQSALDFDEVTSEEA
jgi:putative DNA methylase